MKYPAYPKYKPSGLPACAQAGVEWLGEVPEHWEVKRLKRVLSEPLKYGANESAELDDPDLPRYVRITDVHENGSLREETFRSLPKEIAAPYLLNDGDLLFARSGATSGKTFLYRSSWGICAYAGYLIRARMNQHHAVPAFVKYFTNSISYWQWLSSIYIQATIQNVSAEKYADLQLPLPPLPEQRAIADFLDRETAKLDTLVAKKRELIEKLKEKRTALISRTVTRGLPPEAARAAGLDPHPKLKPSGIEWLGEVPEHWEVKRLKTSAAYWVSNVDKVASDEELPIRLCNYTDVYNNDYIHPNMDLMQTTSTADEIVRFGLHVNDVVITKDSEEWNDIAVPALVVESAPDLVCGYHLAIVRPNEQILLGRFLFRSFQSCALNQQFQIAAAGVTRYGLPKSSIGEALILLPPLPEQRAIADYLDRETAKIDQMAAKVEEAIARLQEYRTALITAAVTGKIDVRRASSEVGLAH